MTENQKQSKALALKAIAWLKKQAIEKAKRGEWYSNISYNTGQIVRGLGLGNGWDARDKVYRQMLAGLKRGEELGFVKRVSYSPVSFAYVGPEMEASEQARKNKVRQTEERMQKLAKRLQLKGVEVYSDLHEHGHKEPTRVSLTPAAFEKLVAKAGVII